MPAYETVDSRLARQAWAKTRYQEATFATPDEIMQVDSVREAKGELPSRFGRDMTRMAAAMTTFRDVDRQVMADRRESLTATRDRALDTAVEQYGRLSSQMRRAQSWRSQLEREEAAAGPMGLDLSGPYAGQTVPVAQPGRGGRLGAVGDFLVDSAQRVPSDILNTLGVVGENLQRPQGAILGSIRGMEDRPVWQAPLGAVEGAITGFRDPNDFGGGAESSLGQRVPEQYRGAAGLAIETAFDPIDLLTGGTVGTDAARAVGRGVRSLDDDVVHGALRAAEGPLDASTIGRLREGATPGAVDPVIPGVTPRGRANIRGAAEVAEEAPRGFQAPPTVRRLYGVDAIEEGAQRGRIERFMTEGRLREDDAVATPALLVRQTARRAVQNQATRTAESLRPVIDETFEVDDTGRIARLAGIDETVPGAPTIRDVAARLPVYEPYLTARELDVLEEIRTALTPYRQALDEVVQAETAITGKPSAINVGSRPDVMDGGFYIPRGNAETEELADIASRRLRGSGGRSGKAGFEKTATFGSEAEGIEAGYGYTPITESIRGYVTGIGNRTLDRHAANYFLSRTDDTGRSLAETAAQRAMRTNPQLKSEVTALKNDLTNLRGAEGRLTARQERVVSDFLDDPDMGDIEALRDAVDSISIGTFRGQPGRNFGMTVEDVRGMKQAILDRIEELRPEYRQLTAQSLGTPRVQGRIPLSGLEAYSFPWEIADEATRILDAEGRSSGAALKALNGLLRGVQATGEMSYLGIQGAIGMASGNRAWRRATKAATEAWMNGGERALGDHFRQFDARSAKSGLPTLEEWGANGLQLGAGRTEFEIGRSLGSRVKAVTGIERADRGFGTFGDVLRAEMADMVAAESRAAGRALDEKELRNIATSVNRVTGWSPTRAGGSVGEALNFAPRYLAARIQSLGQLASTDPRQRQLARRLIGRYIGLASLMTVAINEANGEGTDFRPFRGEGGAPTWNPMEATGKNPNFMRVRDVANRDWSLLGPVDATMGVLIGAGSLLANPTANPEEALSRLRSVLTAPLASAGLDWLVFKENFDRDELNTAPALARDLMHRVVPFAAPELLDVSRETFERASAGDASGAMQEGLGGLLQAGLGFRGTPMTVREEVDAGRFSELKPDEQFQGTSAESWRLLSRNPSFQNVTDRYGTYGQWYQDTAERMYDGRIARGDSPGEARAAVESEIRKQPIYEVYNDVRRAVMTKWVREHPAEAVRLWDEEARKPQRERDWTPTKEQRELMSAYIEATTKKPPQEVAK